MNFKSTLVWVLTWGVQVCHASLPMADVMQDLEDIPEAVAPKENTLNAKKTTSRTTKTKIAPAHPLYKELRFAAMRSNQATSLKENALHRPTLVVFWGSFCGPCLQEFPSLERLSKKLPELKIISVAVDGKNEYSSELPLFYLHQGPGDQNQKFLEKHSISGVPAFFLFNVQGNLLWSDVGAREWDAPENVKKLHDFLHPKTMQIRPSSIQVVKKNVKNVKKRSRK